MANDLLSYLAKNPITEQEVSIPGRLAQFKFKIKPMSAKEFYKYQQIATTMGTGKNKDIKFNTGRFNEQVIINHVTSPNFKDANLLSGAECNTPEEYLNKFFLAGELANLSDKISELSGFQTTDEELEDEAKNS